MILLARILKFLFRFPFFEKRYFGIYQRVIRPWGWFKKTMVTIPYDKTLQIQLHLRDWIQQQIYFFNYYDERGIRCIKKELKKGATFLDIGGNIGAYTLIAAKEVGNTGRVIAFEPVSDVRERLQENCDINELVNVTIAPVALFHENSTLTLHLSSKENFGMSSMHKHDEETGREERVKAVRLDDFVREQQIEKVDFIKMDIEGAELYALLGMKEVLTQYRPAVLIEVCPDVLEHAEYNEDAIFTFFKELGYQPFRIDQEGNKLPYSLAANDGYTNYLFKLN